MARRIYNRVTGHLSDGRRFVTEHRVRRVYSLGRLRYASAYTLAYENRAGTDWHRASEMVGFGYATYDLAAQDMERSIAGLLR